MMRYKRRDDSKLNMYFIEKKRDIYYKDANNHCWLVDKYFKIPCEPSTERTLRKRTEGTEDTKGTADTESTEDTPNIFTNCELNTG